MRVTNNMMVNNLLRNLYKNYTKMDRTQQMLASQKKFLRPSDDPIGVTRSLRLTTEILNMQQYKRNAEDTDSWLQSSEQAVKNIISVLQRIRELTVQGSSETYSEDDRKKIADEIRELKQQLIGIGNTTYAGSFLFSGFKTDKALLTKDGTYDLGGGMLSGGEVIEVNIGISDRIGMNILGQRIFGSMPTTTYDEYVLKGISEFKGVTFDGSNNVISIQYGNLAPVDITMDNGTYTSIDVLRFINDLNDKIAASSLNGLVRAELENGIVVLKGARNIKITGAGIDTKDVMGIEIDRNAASTKVTVSDLDYIDREISYGSTFHLLKASGNFTGVAANSEFIIYYGNNTYTIKMDRTYDADDDMEFVYDFNKKLAETPGLAGHMSLAIKDGVFTINADQSFKLEGTINTNFENLGFIDGVGESGLKSTKAAYAIEGGKLDLFNYPVTIEPGKDKLYINCGGKSYTINLTAKTYDDTPGNTFNDLINDIQKGINSIPELRGYITVTGEDGRIRFNADAPFELVYGVTGNFSSVTPNIDNTNDRLDITLGNGSPITIKIPHGNYANINEFTQALQSAIDADLSLRGKVNVANDGTNITFYSPLSITLSPSNGSGLLISSSQSTNEPMDSIGFNTSKSSVYIGDRVESGGATQLLGVLDQLIKDLEENNSEGIERALSRLDAQLDNINAIRAEIGVKTNRVELTLNRIEDDNVNLRGLLSKNEDIDMAETLMNLQMQYNVYNAALSVGAKIITLSLVDFLR